MDSFESWFQRFLNLRRRFNVAGHLGGRHRFRSRMMLDSESPEAQETPSGICARLRPWLSRAVIFALISASTFILLLCPCDRPGGSAYAIFLVSLACLVALGAAFLIYRHLRQASDATVFISAFKALGIVSLAVYAELRVAVVMVEWLARSRH
jgi:hypothetical protein